MAKIVVLIDDDPDDLVIMNEAIRFVNPALVCMNFINPVEAVRLLRDETTLLPNYIFIDINMPRKNGSECLKDLRRVKALKEVPIIIHSTSLPEKISKSLIEAGADFTFQKPCSVHEYINILQLIFNQSH